MNAFLRQAEREVPERIVFLTGFRIYHQSEPSVKTGEDPDLVVHAGGKVFVIEVKASARTAIVAQAARRIREMARRIDPAAIPLVVVPYMGEAGARICEEQKVGFLDLSGNARIAGGSIHVHVEGKPNRFVKRGRPSSPFAPKSARVARRLLLEPDRWWLQKDLAAATGLGPGFVSRIVRRLGQENLLERKEDRRLRAAEPYALLQAWSDEYDFTKHDTIRLHVPERSGPDLIRRIAVILDGTEVRYAFTGLSAAWKYEPFAAFRLATLYAEQPPDLSRFEEIGGREVERGANLWWTVPNDEGVFDGEREIDLIPCVSAVQAYLDLHAHPERSAEAAEHLRDSHLRWRGDAG